MIRSIWRYAQNFTRLLVHQEGRKLLRQTEHKVLAPELAGKALVHWLLRAQEAQADGGFSTWYIDRGWTSSYPETTGYIVPALLEAGKWLEMQAQTQESARKALDWLLEIQFADGGWPGGYVAQKRPAVVFNTAQVIRGMLAGWEHFQEERYLASAVKAGTWLVDIQDAQGFWSQSVYLNRVRVYDTYVAAPLAALYLATDNEVFAGAARKQCSWVIREKQQASAWFADADNTIQHNNRPILHTIAYTIDGLIETGVLLKHAPFVEAGKRAADVLLEKFLQEGRLHGRYDASWRGTEAFITTGGAQMSIAWQRLWAHTGEQQYREAASMMNSWLRELQVQEITWPCQGALFGSAPLWGRYEAFGCPNWASKYFLEALTMEALQTNQNH